MAAVAAPGGSADGGAASTDDDVDDIVKELQPPFHDRDEEGSFSGDLRRTRRRQVPTFPIIELVEHETAVCSEPNDYTPATCPFPITCTAHGGTPCRTWLIRAPVLGWSDDAWRLSRVTTVRACATLPAHEVYVRSMPWLAPGPYINQQDAYDSVRFVARQRSEVDKTWDAGSPTSSFRGHLHDFDLDDDDVKEILQTASASVRRSNQTIKGGYVDVIDRRSARNDRVYVASFRALLRQRSSRAVRDYRRKGAGIMRTRWRRLADGMGAGTVAAMRRILELEPRSPSRGTGKRSTRIRVSWGASQMRLLPSRDLLRRERRAAFDAEDRIKHFFWTRESTSELVRWDYVRGSGSNGIRRYRTPDGEEKRLRAYTNKYWEAPSETGEGDTDSSGDEDDGFYFHNDNAETEGCYADLAEADARMKEIIAHSNSYLENEDGSGELKILAVGFDFVSMLQRAIDKCAKDHLTGAVVAAATSPVLTFAADGGQVRGKSLTAFTAALAWKLFDHGRTDLLPLAYSLSGEKQVDKLVALAVRDMLKEVMSSTFTVSVDNELGNPGVAADNAAGAASPDRVPVRLFEEVQVCGMCVASSPLITRPVPVHLYRPLNARIDACPARLPSRYLTSVGNVSKCSLLPRMCMPVLLLVGDFSMLHWIHGMTGSGDVWRCVHRAGCIRDEYLRPSCHMEEKEDRSATVVCEQWHVAVWTVATWAMSRKDCRVIFQGGEAYVHCPSCQAPLPVDDDGLTSGQLQCQKPSCIHKEGVLVLQDIARTPFDDAVKAARTACGGVRGYPLLRGMRYRLQLPVLHCTGNIAKMLNNFTLACMPEAFRDAARCTLLAISGKGSMDALYLREHRELVAHAAARPDIFSRDLDVVFVMLLKLVQLVNASWRASLADEEAAHRDGAASITRLAASVLGPLLEEVKFLDPETKSAKVYTLYMHAPVAHLRHHVGSKLQGVAFVADDLMEGHLRGVGRFMYKHGNNASQAALLSDLAGLIDTTVKFSTPRSHPSSLVFTKHLRVCECWKSLGTRGPADYQALQDIAAEDEHLSVQQRDNGADLVFTLPLHDVVDANKARRFDSSGKTLSGQKEALRRGLRKSQAVINACFCGRMTGRQPSRVMALARARQAAAKTKAATASGTAVGTDAAGGTPSSRSGSDDDEGHRTATSDEEAPVLPLPGAVLPSVVKAKRTAVSTDVRRSVPPMWLLRKVFPDPASYTAVEGIADGGQEPSPAVADAAIRQHITICRCFLMRTRTEQFARWAVHSKVEPSDMVEAATTLVDRLTALRMASVPITDEDVVMEF